MSNSRISLGILLIVLLILPLAIADNNLYLERGNNADNNYNVRGNSDISVGFRLETPPSGATGSITEVIVADLTKDLNNEIFQQSGNNTITILSGNNPTAQQNGFVLGDFDTNPTVCDVDNDGTVEFVGVFNNGSFVLASIGLDSTAVATVEATTLLANQTNINGELVCNKFFITEGDNDNYVLFLDAKKFLHIAKVAGGVWVDQIIDVDGAVGNNLGDAFSFSTASHQIIVSDNFDARGKRTVFFTAGCHAHVYTSDDKEDSTSFCGDVAGTPTVTKLHSFNVGGTLDSHAVIWTKGASGVGGEAGLVKFNTFNFLGSTQINKLSPIFDLSPNAEASGTVYDWNGDGIDELVIFDQLRLSNPLSWIVSMNNMSQIGGGSISAACGNPGALKNNIDRVSLAHFDSDNTKDMVAICEVSGGSGDAIVILDGDAEYQTNLTSIRTTNYDTPAPILVDYNNDGALDMILSNQTATQFFTNLKSSATSVSFPFSVKANNTVSLRASQETTGLFDNPDQEYSYAIVCNVESQAIWSEQFTIGYNFTPRNVSLNVVPPEDLLAVEGISTTLGGNITQLNVLKENQRGERDFLDLRFQFVESANRTWDLFYFADDNLLTAYWRINKTNSNIEISKIVGSDRLSVANTTVSNPVIDIGFNHRPEFDSFNNIRFFSVDILVNGVNVTPQAGSDTFQFDGENIRNVQLFTDDNGSVIISRMELIRNSDLEPDFLFFQNGIREVTNDIIHSVSGDGETTGDGFTIVTGRNDTFFNFCEYPESGTFLQRHYLQNVGSTADYTNSKDLRVTVEFVIPTDTDENTLGSNEQISKTDEFLTDLLGEGFTSTEAKFFIWTLVMLFVLIPLFIFNQLMAFIAIPFLLIMGSYFGMIPIAFIIILIIFAAVVTVLIFKRTFGNGGEGF